MSFVLDASVTIVWAMQDEMHPVADLAFEKLDTEQALVPALWWYEVRNILVVNERRMRISVADSTQFQRDLGKYPIRIGQIFDRPSLVDLARRFQITVYDAAYLELAIREQVPLATLDKALRVAAEAAGVPLLA